MRPVGGSATEASDGGVGARGGKSGGVAPESTARTGVKVALATGQSGARPRRSSPVPTNDMACIIRLRGCYRHRPPFAGFSTRQVPRWSLTRTRLALVLVPHSPRIN